LTDVNGPRCLFLSYHSGPPVALLSCFPSRSPGPLDSRRHSLQFSLLFPVFVEASVRYASPLFGVGFSDVFLCPTPDSASEFKKKKVRLPEERPSPFFLSPSVFFPFFLRSRVFLIGPPSFYLLAFSEVPRLEPFSEGAWGFLSR